MSPNAPATGDNKKSRTMKNIYTIIEQTPYTGREYKQSGTLEQLVKAYGYTLQCGESWQYNRASNKKVNKNPKTIKSLIDNLNKASHNRSVNGNGSYYYLAD